MKKKWQETLNAQEKEAINQSVNAKATKIIDRMQNDLGVLQLIGGITKRTREHIIALLDKEEERLLPEVYVQYHAIKKRVLKNTNDRELLLLARTFGEAFLKGNSVPLVEIGHIAYSYKGLSKEVKEFLENWDVVWHVDSEDHRQNVREDLKKIKELLENRSKFIKVNA